MCQGRRSCFADYKVGEAQTLWRRCEKPIAALVDGVAPSLALVIISIQPLGKGATPLPDEPELPTDASPLSEAPRAAGEAAENAPLFPYDSEPLIPQISFAPPQRWRLLIEGAVRVTYDDNITRQESNEQSDVVFALAPRVSVEVGDFRDKTENFLIFTGAPTAFHFLENTVRGHDRLRRLVRGAGGIFKADPFGKAPLSVTLG